MIPAHPTVTPPQSGSGRKKHTKSKAAESAAVPRRCTHIRLLNGNLTAAVRGARGDSPLRSLGVAQGRFSFGKRIALAKCAAQSAASFAALGGKKGATPCPFSLIPATRAASPPSARSRPSPRWTSPSTRAGTPSPAARCSPTTSSPTAGRRPSSSPPRTRMAPPPFPAPSSPPRSRS